MTAAPPFLPYGRQSIDESDVRAVVEALGAEALTTGPGVPAFEAQFAGAVGARHAVVSNSGTAALHLPLLALGIGPGDLALVASVSFIATANAARFCGADVAFADVDPASGLVTPDTLRAAVERAGRAPRVVLPVHLNGWVADPAGVAELARGWDAAVVEDACHAVGGRYDNHSVGACAHAAFTAFSLHPVKTITMGEGGVTTTDDEALAEGMRRARNHGMTRDPARFANPEQAFGADGAPNPWYYEMQELGFNYRATDVACALGASQLRRLDGFVARRRQLQARYDAALADLAPHVRPVAAQPGQSPALHLYAVRIAFAGLGIPRAAVMEALKARGIGTQVHYMPIYRQPYYEGLYGRQRLPGAEAYYDSILSLPFFPAMQDEDVDRVVGALRAVLGI
ncbi:UDP-4-amino-4,6-dideoxy-N-acetyl-beta-L-altrosamine transaminase [Azospirillum sp.]|uniref:UDP-4-amino-4, 6-dideoxy-N-acetyl-beta-L-altrosamine transaminase n=1 Tax=Azospirillum sp. TaxID=34012 RepID=UPI003D711F6C